MITIKRYPNRKLYDTAARQYVSLDDVAEMIRGGAELQVMDHATGEDLTTLTLTQIIVEQEKARSGFLPLPVLTGMIKTGGHTLASLRRGLAAPLDLLRGVDEEIERRVQKLIGLGELAEDEGRRLLQKLQSVGASAAESARAGTDRVEQELRSRMLPTRADVQALSEQLDRLSDEVDALIAEKPEARA